MDSNTIFTPEVIPDTPFPMSSPQPFTVSQGGTNGVFTPGEIADNPLPEKVTAQQLLSDSIDTQGRTILKEYVLAQSGGFSIGKYQNGLSGDIKITPAGIVARNISGDQTLSIDGETGDATFKGTILAGDVEVADADGLISLNNFATGSKSKNGINTSTSTTGDPITFDDRTNSLDTDVFTREVKAIILAQAAVYGTQADGNFANGFSGEVFVDILVNGVSQSKMRMRAAFDPSVPTANSDITTLMCHAFVTLPAGSSSLQLLMRRDNFSNFKAAGLNFELSYMVLGK